MHTQTCPNKTKPTFQGKYADLGHDVIDVFYQVHNELGNGFSEKVYQNTVAIALREKGFKVEEQIAITVHFHEQIVGKYFYVLNFGKSATFKRKIFDNERKGSLQWTHS